jgi:hypothetical protein
MNHPQPSRRRGSTSHFFEFKDGLDYEVYVFRDGQDSPETLRVPDAANLLNLLEDESPQLTLLYVLYVVK